MPFVIVGDLRGIQSHTIYLEGGFIHGKLLSKLKKASMTAISEGWVAFLDVYGFSAMLKEMDISELHQAITRSQTQIRSSLAENQGVLYYFFSDSTLLVFLSPPAKKESTLRKSISKIQNVMGIYYNNNLPVRGGMAYGSVSYDDTTAIGKPILNAVNYEKELPLPLVFLPYSEMKETRFKPSKVKDTDIIILKDSTPVAGILIPPFPIESLTSAITHYCEIYLVDGPSGPAKAWYEAKKYLERLQLEV